MSKKKEYDQKHLTTSQRIHIEKGLNDGLSFAAIARKLDKHPSTISKEVKKYRTFQPHEFDPKKPARCAFFKECTMRFLCDEKDCVNMCKSCFDVKRMVSKCTFICPEYTEPQCPLVQKAPFVCNHCLKLKRCNKNKAFYIAQNADKSSQALLVSSRIGINQHPADIALLDDVTDLRQFAEFIPADEGGRELGIALQDVAEGLIFHGAVLCWISVSGR